MLQRYLSIILAVLIAYSAHTSLIFAQMQTGGNTAKVKAEVARLGANEKKRVRVKMLNGTKIKGSISQIADDSFTLTNSKTKQPTVIVYSDAKNVESGGLAGGARVGIIVGAAVGATLIILYAAFQHAIRNN
jgi:sRNA-binding regulator protein Hfq